MIKAIKIITMIEKNNNRNEYQITFIFKNVKNLFIIDVLLSL